MIYLEYNFQRCSEVWGILCFLDEINVLVLYFKNSCKEEYCDYKFQV